MALVFATCIEYHVQTSIIRLTFVLGQTRLRCGHLIHSIDEVRLALPRVSHVHCTILYSMESCFWCIYLTCTEQGYHHILQSHTKRDNIHWALRGQTSPVYKIRNRCGTNLDHPCFMKLFCTNNCMTEAKWHGHNFNAIQTNSLTTQMIFQSTT